MTETDLPILLDFLNAQSDLAWIVGSAETGYWKAQSAISSLEAGRYGLWHVPSGPLPLVGAAPRDPTDEITDPWSGWRERRRGADPRTPYFGPGHPGMFWLDIRPAARNPEEICGLSAFEWIGRHFSLLGSVPTPATEKLWEKMRRYLKKVAVRVPRGDLNGIGPKEIYAFPDAFERFKSGERASINPY